MTPYHRAARGVGRHRTPRSISITPVRVADLFAGATDAGHVHSSTIPMARAARHRRRIFTRRRRPERRLRH